MNEQELIQQYYFLQGQLKDVVSQLEGIYVPIVSKAIEENDAQAIRDVLARCPDNVISAFIYDAAVHSGVLPKIKWLED